MTEQIRGGPLNNGMDQKRVRELLELLAQHDAWHVETTKIFIQEARELLGRA